jgi:hypothetical protein
MNIEDDYYDGDMSDDEYRMRIRREQERDEYYANVRKSEIKDKSPYRFSSDDDDQYLSY